MPELRSSAAYRIAVFYAALLAWLLVVLGGTLYYIAGVELSRGDDHEIARELDRLAAIDTRTDLLRELRWRANTAASNRFHYVLFDPAGQEIGGGVEKRSIHGGSTRPTPAPRQSLLLSPNEGTLVFTNGERLTVRRDPGSADRTKAIILRVFAVAGVVGLAISLLTGVIVARYLQGRLRPIHATAKAVATGDINWRVPVREPGDEFDTAGRSINLMLDRIGGLMENLRQVSSDIAHDLRKPLMQLLVQTDRIGRVEGAEQRIYELGDEMLMLFSSILRIAEVEGGGLEHTFQAVDLSALMNDVAESFAPALDDSEHTIDWTIAPQVTVMGNRQLLAQVASNLLDNARVHTPPGTAIHLRLTVEGGSARLCVEDDGPGVSEEDRGKLLQRFFRAESSRTMPGNGLGLSLVAAAAAAHGGGVVIEAADPGLRIIVILPVSRSPAD